MDYQVTCINKPNRYDPHSRIQRLGGPGWSSSADDVIRDILLGFHTYYVQVGTLLGGARANVIVRYRNDEPYLTTSPDGVQTDNLLSLPECPGGLQGLFGAL
jgi:hypothetical protein